MDLQSAKILQLVHDAFEDLELWYPVLRLREEGVQVDLAGANPGHTYAGKHGVPAVTDISFKDADPRQYDGILVPGGWAPDKLRRYPKVLDLIRHMDEEKKMIGEICHAGWVLISAGILEGRKVTSTPGIKDDMMNAGAEWSDTAVVRDGHLISSRQPPDLPVYMRTMIEYLRMV